MRICASIGSLRYVTVPDSLIDEAARRFALLSDPTRLRILAVLLEQEPMTVTELSDALGIAAPNVSQHLARLSAGRLVGREKQTGKWWISIANGSGTGFNPPLFWAMLDPALKLPTDSSAEASALCASGRCGRCAIAAANDRCASSNRFRCRRRSPRF